MKRLLLFLALTTALAAQPNPDHSVHRGPDRPVQPPPIRLSWCWLWWISIAAS